MWEYLALFGTLFMTWYDNLWLKKFLKFSEKNGKWAIWELMKLHARIQQNNEMVKDGYHVDSVFLYVHEREFIKQYDMLRVFREKLVEPSEKPTIRIDSDVNFFDFVKMCCDPDTNFKEVDEDLFYLLEVNYTFDRKKYRIYYDSKRNTNIRFPVYSDKEIRERDIFEGGVNSALVTERDDDESGIDVTHELKMLAGPMQNFYDDTEYVTLKEWFMGDRFSSSHNIQIIDFIGEFHTISSDEKFLSFIRNQQCE